MTGSLERGKTFGMRELPLPSDLNSHSGEVDKLMALWMVLRQNRDLPRETCGKIVNRFFDGLSEELMLWFEEDDPKWEISRALLTKQRALQLFDLRQRGLLEAERMKIVVETYRVWIDEAKEEGQGEDRGKESIGVPEVVVFS